MDDWLIDGMRMCEISDCVWLVRGVCVVLWFDVVLGRGLRGECVDVLHCCVSHVYALRRRYAGSAVCMICLECSFCLVRTCGVAGLRRLHGC